MALGVREQPGGLGQATVWVCLGSRVRLGIGFRSGLQSLGAVLLVPGER